MEHIDDKLEQGGTPEPSQGENPNMASLLEEEGLGIDFPKSGEIRKGMIASLTPGQILVSVGTKSEGVITGREYDAIPQEELAELKVGMEIPVFVINPEDSSGNLVLSYMRAREETSWKDVEDLRDAKTPYHSKIVGYNKGGLIVLVHGLRGFVPASQIALSRRSSSSESPEARWARMIGEEIDVIIIEVDRERRRLILSERAASTETRESLKERVIEELKEGEIRTGRVTSLAEFGAFVNISGADGLVHLSEISWGRIQHPGEVLKVGQEVKVKIISIDREKKRIGLSIRALESDPWSERVGHYQVGQLVEATITRLTKFGAFARLEDDLEGLIHISEISEKRIEHPKEVLKEGERVTLRVIKIDPDNHRIGLSLRRVESMAYADQDWQLLQDEIDNPTVTVEKDETESGEPIGEIIKPAKAAKKVKPTKPVAEEAAPVEPDPSDAKPTKAAKKVKPLETAAEVQPEKPAKKPKAGKPAVEGDLPGEPAGADDTPSEPAAE